MLKIIDILYPVYLSFFRTWLMKLFRLGYFTSLLRVFRISRYVLDRRTPTHLLISRSPSLCLGLFFLLVLKDTLQIFDRSLSILSKT